MFLCPCGCTRAVESTSFSMNRCRATARHHAWAPSRLHRPRRHRESATAAALFPLAPTLFTFCSRHSQAEWLKASQKEKNLRFRIWFPLRLASSRVFLAKSTSQFFPLWLLVASLCHAPTHSLICISTIVAGDPEGSTSPAPIFFKGNYSALVYQKRKKDKRKRKLAASM